MRCQELTPDPLLPIVIVSKDYLSALPSGHDMIPRVKGTAPRPLGPFSGLVPLFLCAVWFPLFGFVCCYSGSALLLVTRLGL